MRKRKTVTKTVARSRFEPEVLALFNVEQKYMVSSPSKRRNREGCEDNQDIPTHPFRLAL
jgi:hypothetical protein